MLSYTGPVYAEIGVAPNETQRESHEVFAQNDIVVGELPSGKIRIYTDRSQTTTVELDKQDCEIMRKEDNSIGLGFKFGGLMWGFGPEIKIGHSSGIEWKSDVQRMVAEYQELCTQFNTGRLSQEEYKFEKKGIIQRGYGYAKELEKRFKQKKEDMFREMDQGRYISLQNARFYEGCCVTEGLPVSRHDEEREELAERERKILEDRERKILEDRERIVAEREQMLQAQRQAQKVERNMLVSSSPFRKMIPTDCRDMGVCNRSRNFNSVVPDRFHGITFEQQTIIDAMEHAQRMNRIRGYRGNSNGNWNIRIGGRW
jgi:hypothetical protein